MCLAVPGKIVSLNDSSDLLKLAWVDFGGVKKEVSLVYTPQATIGDYVIVHVGFAISIMNELEAKKLITAIDNYLIKDEISN